jgi:uncharacterized protein (DUF58 family)
MSDTSETLLDPRSIAQGEALGLLARQVVEGFLSGEHKSPFRGFAIEFHQHREYAPGDDLRHLDWKVLARSDRFYLKQYEQETNFVCHVLVDASESMNYASKGRPTKLQYARQLAACLCYLVLHQRDACSLVLFDSSVRRYVPRTSSLASIHSILSLLASTEPAPGEAGRTSMGPVLHQLAASNPRKGIFVIVSDLLDDEEAVLSGIQHLRFLGHEVIVFHTLDPFELTFPFTGNVEFDGFEAPAKVLTRPNELRKSYLAEFDAFRQRVRFNLEKNKSHYVLADTSHPLAETLGGYLAFREKTHGR